MINLSLDELKLVAKNRDIKGYKSNSEEHLIKILTEPKQKISISEKKKEIKKKFRKSLCNIKNYKNLSAIETRKTGKNLIELEIVSSFKSLMIMIMMTNTKKIRRVRRLFNQFDRDYYKSIKIINSFDNKKGYTGYRSSGDKYENLSPKEYLDMIRPHLRDMTNDHKTTMKLPDKVIDSEIILVNRKFS